MRTIICFVLCAVPLVVTCRAEEVITNETVVKMVKAGLSEELIIQAVQQQEGKYRTAADDLISLKAAGVSEKVLSAILTHASKAGPSPETGRPAFDPVATHRNHRTIQVMKFDQQPGSNMPPDKLSALAGEIVSALSETGKFDNVLIGDEKSAEGQPGLRLVGTVVKFKRGNRAARYMLGPASLAGPGKTVVKAHIKLLDNATGQLLHEQDVDGRVWIGMFGGSSDGAKQGLAKEVAKVVSKKADGRQAHGAGGSQN